MSPLDRRRFIQQTAVGALTATGLGRDAHAAEGRPPNVLMIVVDDLNDWIGPLGGHPQARTPNLDRLAARGFTFANAHCPAPICTPARSAVLTGIHPSRSGLYFLEPLFRETPTLADAVTLPQHFRRHGYHAMGVGKVFHRRHDADSFDETGGWVHRYGPLPDEKLGLPGGHPLWDWGAYPTDGAATPDDKIAQWAVDRLGRRYDRPFFLAAGFIRPHVPMYAPPEYFDAFPAGETILPRVPERDEGLTEYAKQLIHAGAAPRHADVLAAGQWEDAVRGYLASIRYVDDQIGWLLDALDDSPHASNTVVALWADHGFHLGEHRRWGKRSLWEESTRVPLLMAGPGVPRGRTDAPVGTLDLYPTLASVCGLPEPVGLDARDLAPLLDDPRRDWPHAAVTTFGPGNHGVRTRRHRYIRYGDGSEALYDHADDPDEWHNLADDPAHADALAEHRRHLPTTDAPLVMGSAGSDSPLFP